MRPDRRRGIVLLVVLFFTLLLTSTIVTFVRRAAVDRMIARNRDAAQQAEALARGGVELAKALLLEDKLREAQTEFAVESSDELWALAGHTDLPVGDGTLRLEIRDAGSRLNLNALFEEGSLRDERSALLLEALLERVIAELPGRPEDKPHDPRELADHLIDFIDADGERRASGALEDDYYQRQDPPYAAANRPLLSLDELRLVEGFDGALVEALEPYLTVHPQAGGGGINPNTAPAHVLGLLYHGVSEGYRLADADQVADLLALRETGGIWCDETASYEGCRPLAEVLDGEIYPPPSFTADVFTVVSRATVGEVTRSVEAVLDRSELPEVALLAWRTR